MPQAAQPLLATCPRAGHGGGILTVAHALQEVFEGFSQLPGLQEGTEGQAWALTGCLGFRERGDSPHPRPGKGGRERQESHLCDLGEPPGICHLQGERGGRAEQGPPHTTTPSTSHTILPLPPGGDSRQAPPGGWACGGDERLTFRKVVVVGSSLELHSTWGQGASFSRVSGLRALGDPPPSC